MKKPGGIALILGADKPKAEGGSGEGLKASADELADIVGVPEERREAFASALHAYVRQCADAEESAESPDEEKAESDY